MRRATSALLLACAAPALVSAADVPQPSRVDKLTYHYDRQRTGWNSRETTLTPATVSGGNFGPLWQSPQLDGFGDMPAKLFATVLYVDSVELGTGEHRGKPFSIVYAVTTTGYAYAINAAEAHGVAPGTILWRARLTDEPCGDGEVGSLATPVIDLKTNRIYLTSCDTTQQWRAHALDIRTGEEVPGWPAAVTAEAINRPGINRNGAAQFPKTLFHWNRGALNLSPDGTRIYFSFGKDGQSGWLVAVDTNRAQVSSAFSTTAVTEEVQGGMWASGGAAIDDEGRIYIATGASYYLSSIKKAGIAGVFPNSDHSWGQSILQLRDDPADGLTLTGTYTPFNYCQTAAADIDLGSSGAIAIELPASSTGTPKLMALGGAKQGNLYLLDRDNMPGSLTKRQPCSADSASDRSLLAPEAQPQFGKRGPLNVFGPYAEDIGMLDQAKSRSTAAYFQDGKGGHFLFLTGSAKTGADYSKSIPPGLAKIRIVAAPGQPAFPRIEKLETTQTFVNPGSPIVTSNGTDGAIVWVLDANVPRTAAFYGDNAAKPVLYAFDASSLELLWRTPANELHTGGKYNEPTIANGLVLVGTDRVQAYGVKTDGGQAAVGPDGFTSLFDGRSLAGWKGDPALWSVREGAITGETKQAVGGNTFLYSDRAFGDFELRLKYRFLTPTGNSGVQVRSRVLDESKFAVGGYQANVVTPDAGKRFGMLVDERGRYDLAYLGEVVEVSQNGTGTGVDRKVLGSTGQSAELLKHALPYPAWNDYSVIAYGDRLVNVLNGHVLTDVTDRDPRAAKEGILAFQLHGGSTMGVQFKDVRIKPLRTAPVIKARPGATATAAPAKPATTAMARPKAAPPKPVPARSPTQEPDRLALTTGRQLFQQRCAGCHTTGAYGVPSRSKIAALPRARIIQALTTGAMKPMAMGISKEQIGHTATYLKSIQDTSKK